MDLKEARLALHVELSSDNRDHSSVLVGPVLGQLARLVNVLDIDRDQILKDNVNVFNLCLLGFFHFRSFLASVFFGLGWSWVLLSLHSLD